MISDDIKRVVPIIEGDADVWAIFRHPALSREILERMAAPYRDKVTHVVGVESRGFLVGMALAQVMNLPFVGVRKDTGFFPGDTISYQSQPDYRGNQHTLRIQSAALAQGDVVLMADDWIETGNQAMCVKALVEKTGAKFYGVSTIVDQTSSERASELGVFTGLITNTELFQGQDQRDYQSEADGA